MNVLLFGHGSFYNRGCEAIVKSIVNYSRNFISRDLNFFLATFDYRNDKKRKDIDVFLYVRQKPGIFSVYKYQSKLLEVVFKDYRRAAILRSLPLKKFISKSDICVSIGGDNYCYEKKFIYFLNSIDREVKRQEKKLILLGASFEESNLDEETIEDLRLFDKIIVRESISLNMLRERNIDTVYLYPDPAFLLPSERVDEIVPENSVGINLSPLILNFTDKREAFMKEVNNLIYYILKNTDLNIILIPHVFQKNSYYQNDYNILTKIQKEFETKAQKKITLITKHYTAGQLKYIISKLRFFVGARTHSTIAAYSSGVPTIAIAYSTKARGIAKDIFATEENYVFDIRNFEENSLIKSFEWLMNNEGYVKNLLKNCMTEYTNKAIESLKIVFDNVY